ncbi:MAG TPA: phage holin family protein [Gaiella sp.]|nr:phage holin family protein [Gaiella sp.]
MSTVRRNDESTAELVRALKDETVTLVRDELEVFRTEAARIGQGVATLAGQELRLARAEMAQKSRHLIPGLGMMAAAGAAALTALGTLTAFVVLALSDVMDAWLAALIVGLAWVVAAAGLYFAGRERVSEAGPLVPEQTMESVKEDVEWAKTQIG